MTSDSLLQFLRRHKLGVLSTVSKANKPESALVGIAISDRFEVIFDTVRTSRKYFNISQNPFVSMVIGWDDETTVQYEGVASELCGEDADSYKEIYFSVYSDGRIRDKTWPNIVHFKIAPKWLRYSNFKEPTIIEEKIEPFCSL